jgi:hypothetical protein
MVQIECDDHPYSKDLSTYTNKNYSILSSLRSGQSHCKNFTVSVLHENFFMHGLFANFF